MILPDKTCLICNNIFSKKVNCSVKNWANSKFCSKQCADIWRKSESFSNLVSSKRIGNFREGTKHTAETKRKMSLAAIGKPKSEKAKIKMSESKKGLLAGSKHPNWKGGIPQQRNWNVYYWAKSIITRDKECMFPGCTSDEKLHAHHIIKFSENKEISTDMNNGITLCVSCHRKTYFKEKHYENLFKKIVEFVS